MVFLLRELAKLPSSFSVRGAFSNSSAIMVRVERGEHSWLFVDSYWTIRAKLADIGDWLGLKKGGEDKSTDDMTPAELRTYNEQDCFILYEAMKRFQEAIIAVGGEMGITIAATALKTFLRKYLKRPIENGVYLDAYVKDAYTASRVERIREHCENANYYDLNSSFAYSMLGSIPGSMTGLKTGRGATLPDKGLWFADVSLRVNSDYPAVPFKSSSGRVFYPNGEFRAKISSEDMLCGGFEVDKVHSCMTFEERDDMRAYAEDFYRLRLQSGYEGKVYKYALTNLYGKWAEHPDKEVIIVNPDDNDYSGETRMLTPGVTIRTETRPVKHSHIPISATITARSRRYLLERIREAARGGAVYYCDTDSVICDAVLDTCNIAGASRDDHSGCSEHGCKLLGGLKREFIVRRGRFVAPKLYAIEKEPGTYPEKESPQEVKAKGFSRALGILGRNEVLGLPRDAAERENELRRRIKSAKQANEGERVPLTYEVFSQLSEGHAAVIERMLRIKELIKRDGGIDYRPRTVMMTKTLNVNLRPKRRPTTDGGSEPWDVREIEDE